MLEKLIKPDLSVNDTMGILTSYWGYCTVVSFYQEGRVARGWPHIALWPGAGPPPS